MGWLMPSSETLPSSFSAHRTICLASCDVSVVLFACHEIVQLIAAEVDVEPVRFVKDGWTYQNAASVTLDLGFSPAAVGEFGFGAMAEEARVIGRDLLP